MKVIRLLVLLLCLATVVSAQNTAPLTIQAAPMSGGASSYPPVPFDTNKSFLIYTTDNGDLVSAMNYYGLSYTTRSASQPVTLNDLNTHDVLIVGWNTSDSPTTMSGLDPDIIYSGITGRAVITGHDADYHVTHSPEAGNEVFEQMIKFALDGVGTGLVAFGDDKRDFEWLPEEWEIVADHADEGEYVDSITEEGQSSGIYDNLKAHAETGDPTGIMYLSNWSKSYHNIFESWGNGFEPFELQSSTGNDAVTIGTPFNANGFIFTKEDDVADDSCVSPEDDLTYTICYNNTSGITIYNAKIVDYLPKGVTYPEGFWSIDGDMNPIPPDPAYDPNFHTYTWDIGTIIPDEDPNALHCESLDVVVNENAIPGMTLYNEAWLIGEYEIIDPNSSDPNNPSTLLVERVFAIATEETDVCCWTTPTPTPNIIYVDKYATGADTGIDWENAYNTEFGVKKALVQAWESTCSGPFTIYVAEGTYLPGTDYVDSFDLPEGTKVYGGFLSGGCEFNSRDPKGYETRLSGYLAQADALHLVTMGHNTLLDGFTVESASDTLISGEGADFTVENCVIKDSWQTGVYAEGCNVTIKYCLIKNNGEHGIYHQGSEVLNFELNIFNSWIMRNEEHGIQCLYSTPTIKNSIISESDMATDGKEGIRVTNPFQKPIIYNNTISNNKGKGIYFEDDGNASGDPNDVSLDYPDIQNCIVYYNNNNLVQMEGFDPNTNVAYSCIQNCFEVNNNINAAPLFAYPVNPLGAPDPDNYHLAHNSICRDMGSPYLDYSSQVDYDKEIRVAGIKVDIGADELYSCDGDYTEDDFSNDADWNADGIVNMYEFSIFAGSWLTNDPNSVAGQADPNSTIGWDSRCNFDDTSSSADTIDIADFAFFIGEVPWLWKACWYDNYQAVMGGEAAMMSTPETISLMTVEPVARAMAMTSFNTDTGPTKTGVVGKADPYSYLTNEQLAIFVKDIYEIEGMVIEQIEAGSEDKEDLTEILVFFDEILVDIQETLTK